MEILYEILYEIEDYHSNLIAKTKSSDTYAVRKKKPFLFKRVSKEDLIKHQKNKEIVSESIEMKEKN